MKVHTLHDLSNTYVIDILKVGMESSSDHLEENYSYRHKDLNSNLFYILNEGRYAIGQGSYYVIEHNGVFVASSGWNKYNDDTAIVLSRSFVSPEYRTTYIMGEMLLPMMIEECSEFKHVWITCNKYNKAIYNWFERKQSGKRAALYNDWPEIYSRFEPIGKKVIYYTEQYVVRLRK